VAKRVSESTLWVGYFRRWDGRLQGQYDDCERPCVADSCALITVPSQLRQLGDVRRDAPHLVAREQLGR